MQRGPFDQTNDLRRIHGVSKEIFLYRAIVEAADATHQQGRFAQRHRHVDWRTFRIDGRRRWLLYQRRVIRRLAAARPILRLLQKNGEIFSTSQGIRHQKKRARIKSIGAHICNTAR